VWVLPRVRGPLSHDDTRRLVALLTLPSVLAGCAALRAGDVGGTPRRLAGVTAVGLALLLSLGVLAEVVPRGLPLGRLPRTAAVVLASPAVVAGAAATMAVTALRSPVAVVALLAPSLATGLATAGAAGRGARARCAAAGRVLGALTLAGPPVVLAAALAAYVSGALVPLLLAPLHLLLVRVALPPR